MLFSLRQPLLLLGLVLGFAASTIALSAVTRLLNRNSRYEAPFWHPKSWLDPYSAVAAVLAGTGWAPRPEVRAGFGKSRNQQLWRTAAVYFAVPAVLSAAALAGYAVLSDGDPLPAINSILFLHLPDHGDLIVDIFAPTALDKILLGFGIEAGAIAVLSLIPIPPLATGVAAWTVVPKKPGPRQLAYRLLEEHWGIAALLILILLPIGGADVRTPLMYLLTTIEDAIINAF